MSQTVNVILAAEDRERLLAIARDRSRPLKHVQRAPEPQTISLGLGRSGYSG